MSERRGNRVTALTVLGDDFHPRIGVAEIAHHRFDAALQSRRGCGIVEDGQECRIGDHGAAMIIEPARVVAIARRKHRITVYRRWSLWTSEAMLESLRRRGAREHMNDFAIVTTNMPDTIVPLRLRENGHDADQHGHRHQGD